MSQTTGKVNVQDGVTWILKLSHRGLFGQEQPDLQRLVQHLEQARFTGFLVLYERQQARGVVLYVLGAVSDLSWNGLRGAAALSDLQQAVSGQIRAEARRATRGVVLAAQAVLGGSQVGEWRQPTPEQLHTLEQQATQGFTGLIGRLEAGKLKEVFAYADGRAVDNLLPSSSSGDFVQYRSPAEAGPPVSDFARQLFSQAAPVAFTAPASVVTTPTAPVALTPAAAQPEPQPAQTAQQQEKIWQALEAVFMKELGGAGKIAAQRLRTELAALSPEQQRQKIRERIEGTLGSVAFAEFQRRVAE